MSSFHHGRRHFSFERFFIPCYTHLPGSFKNLKKTAFFPVCGCGHGFASTLFKKIEPYGTALQVLLIFKAIG